MKELNILRGIHKNHWQKIPGKIENVGRKVVVFNWECTARGVLTWEYMPPGGLNSQAGKKVLKRSKWSKARNGRGSKLS